MKVKYRARINYPTHKAHYLLAIRLVHETPVIFRVLISLISVCSAVCDDARIIYIERDMAARNGKKKKEQDLIAHRTKVTYGTEKGKPVSSARAEGERSADVKASMNDRSLLITTNE